MMTLFAFSSIDLSSIDLSSTARGTNPTQAGNVRVLHSLTEHADSKTRCRTWRGSYHSLWTPPHSTVTRSSSCTCSVLIPSKTTESHSNAALVGVVNLGYGKSATVFSMKIFKELFLHEKFQGTRKFSPTIESLPYDGMRWAISSE